jgi:hypothetical protein
MPSNTNSVRLRRIEGWEAVDGGLDLLRATVTWLDIAGLFLTLTRL